jgi:hypothetical protein
VVNSTVTTVRFLYAAIFLKAIFMGRYPLFSLFFALRDLTGNTLPLMPCPYIFCMQGAVGANLCVRPVIPGRHVGLPLQSRTGNGDLIFW